MEINLFTKGFLMHLLLKCLLRAFLIFVPLSLISANAQDTNRISLSIQDAVKNALNNNYYIKNAKLQIARSELQRYSSIVLNPTEITYKKGELYSNEKSNCLEINQNFGSLISHIQSLKQAKINSKLQTSSYELAVKEITAEVKSAYVYWQFKCQVNATLEEEKEIYQKLADIAELRYKMGDISLLKRSILLTTLSEINSQFLMSADELTIAENKLKQIMMVEGNFYPARTQPELYTIDPTMVTANYSGTAQLNYYHFKQLLIQGNVNVKKSLYFPELKIGLFRQEIGGLKNLYGYEVGVALPLWIPKQQSEIRQAKIESEIALNDYDNRKQSIFFETENLLFQLNKYFRQIRHYEENALKEAENLLYTAKAQLKAEDIEYTEFLQSVNLAYQIIQAFYLATLNYNQTAIQLELYGE
jgi:cobalt-zinc-cadmium resistance protein CzcA